MKKILVISPHADDEILGCYGYISSEIAKGSKVHVIYGAVGGVGEDYTGATRINEIEQVSNSIGYTYSIIKQGYDSKLDTVSSSEIISFLDKYIEDNEPNEVFVNYPSRHQDHKKIYDCAMASMRLKNSFMPSFFALYEYPFITDIETPNGGYMYLDITNVINEKINAFNTYKSQIKSRPSPLNGEGIEALARMRGIECGVTFAEKYYIQKMVIK